MKIDNGFAYQVYKGCIKLTAYTERQNKEVVIPSCIDGKKVSLLGKNLFQGCSISKLTLPDTIKYINPSMLYGCYSLREIHIREQGGEPRFYRTLKTAIGHRTIKLTGNKNTFSLLLKTEQKLRYILLWLTGRETPFPACCTEEYFQKRGIYALELAASEDNIPALIRGEELNKVTAGNIDRLISAAQSANAAEALAHIMSYKQANFGFSDILSGLSRELTKDPFSPSEIKKSFNIKTEDDRCTVTGYCGEDTDIFIPQRMGKKTIAAIAPYAFSPNKKRGSRPIYDKLTRIDLNSVIHIGEGTFAGCGSLEYCNTRAAVHIPDKCFSDCGRLSSFDFSSVETIGAHSFQGCVSLKNINLTDSITYIGEWAFFGCSSAEELTLSSNLTATPELGFGRCGSLKSISFPKGTVKVGKRSFYECTSLENIEFSPTVIKLDWESFSGCRSIRRLHIPGTLKEVGNSAFYYCTSLTDLILDEGIESLEWGAFNNCQKLEVVHLPENIKKIDSYVFNECYALREIHIPPSITDMRPNVFNSCRFVRIYGKKDSYAREYAWIYGIPFIEDKTMI